MRARKMCWVLALLMIFLFVSISAFSQVGQKGDISGIVKEKNGVVLPGVSITLTGEKLFQRSIAQLSNERGGFRFANLNPGEYTLEFTIQGFNTLKITRISVEVGTSTAISAEMTPESISHEVVVVSQAPLIETKTAQLAVNIDSSLLQETPVYRSVSTFVGLMNTMPGVNDLFAYGSNGGVESSDLSYGSSENGYRFDGMDVSNPNLGYTSLNPIYETIEEFQIVGIGATAEYGGFVGGSFNIVTKSGTNKFHGSVTGLFNNDTFRWNNNRWGIGQLDPQRFKYDMEGTGTLGGPLIKEKLFFFVGAGYAGYQKKWPIFTQYQTSERPRGYAKMDWLIDNRNTVSATFNANPCWIQNTGLMVGYAPSTAANYDLAVMNTLLLTWQTVFSQKTYFNLKVAGWKENYSYYPKYPGVPEYMDLITDQYFGSYMQDQREHSSSVESNATLTHYIQNLLGTSHEIKLGAEYSHGQNTNDFVYSGGGYFLSIPAGSSTIWEAFTGGDTHTQARIDRITGFVQDNLNIIKRLGLNLGLRFEDIRLTARDFSGNVAHFTTLSPRLGMTYDLWGDAKNVFRASWGEYYNKIIAMSFQPNVPGNEDSYTYMMITPAGDISTLDQSLKDQLALISQPQNLISTQYRAVPMAVDPKLKLPKADVLDIGFSKKLGRDFALDIDFMHRNDSNRLEYTSIAQHTYVPFLWTDPRLGHSIILWQQTDDNPDMNNMLTNSSWEKRTSNFLMITLRKQPTKRWTMMFSYVYQSTKSNLPAGGGDLWTSGYWNCETDPFYYSNPFQYGADTDRRHQFKLLGTFFGPWGINISGNFRALSGIPYEAYYYSFYVSGAGVPVGGDGSNTLFRSAGYGYLPEVMIEPRGDRRAGFGWDFDLRVGKAFKIRGSQLELRVDCFNLFNVAYVDYLVGSVTTRYSGTTTSAFGKPWRLYEPRNIYFGFTWRF